MWRSVPRRRATWTAGASSPRRETPKIHSTPRVQLPGLQCELGCRSRAISTQNVVKAGIPGVQIQADQNGIMDLGEDYRGPHGVIRGPHEALKAAISNLSSKLPGRPWRAMPPTLACLLMTPVFNDCLLQPRWTRWHAAHEKRACCSLVRSSGNCQEWDQMLQVLRSFFVRVLEGPLRVNREAAEKKIPTDDTFKKEPGLAESSVQQTGFR